MTTIMTTESPDVRRLGATHSEIGLNGIELFPGTYDDIIVRPEGNFLRIERGEKESDKEGVLVIGKSYYNHKFLSEVRGPKVLRSSDCGCSPEFIAECDKKGWRPDMHDHPPKKGEGEVIDQLDDHYWYREMSIPLPNAVKPAWEVRDSAGADAVAFWAVRLVGDQVAYVQQSGYKGRGGWEIRIVRSDGTVKSLHPDELTGKVRPAKAL